MGDLLDHRTVPEYNTRAVVNRTGVPADTFRAWERRYGLPYPARTEGNHRLYSERDIAIISRLKEMTNDGVTISHAVAKAQRQLNSGPSGQSPDKLLSTSQQRPDVVEVQSNLLTAFREFDTRAANRLVEDAMALVDVESLCIDILEPVLIDIGNQWQLGTLPISVEHFASAFCMRKLSALLNASHPESGDSTVICSSVEGEHHEIGLMMISVLLSRAGFRVIYLGANLPGHEVAAAVRRIQPDAVALSSTAKGTYETLIDVIRRLRHDDSVRAIIGYGGALFERDPERRRSIQAEYLGADARLAQGRLRELIAARTRK